MKLVTLLLISSVLINLDCTSEALTFLVKPSDSTDELVVYGNQTSSLPTGPDNYLRITNAIRETDDGSVTVVSIWQDGELIASTLLQLGQESQMYKVRLGSAIRVTASGNKIMPMNNTLKYSGTETSVDIIVMSGDGESYLLVPEGAVPYGCVIGDASRLEGGIISLSLVIAILLLQ